MGTILIIIYLAIVVFFVAAYWKVYQKAGKPGWACIIPIYSMIVLLDIIKKPIWWIFMFFIPLVNLYFMFLLYTELAKCFGKSAGFGLGLMFLPFIFWPILGFGDAIYVEVEENV